MDGFLHLTSKIVFCGYWDIPHVPVCPYDCVSCLGHSYLVALSSQSSGLCPVRVPCIHDPPTSHSTATGDPVGLKGIFCKYLYFYLTGLSGIIAGLSNLELICVHFSCYRYVYVSIHLITFLWIFLQTLCMPLPVCCFDGSMMMTIHKVYQVTCRSFSTSLIQSLCPCLKLFCWTANTLKEIILKVFN